MISFDVGPIVCNEPTRGVCEETLFVYVDAPMTIRVNGHRVFVEPLFPVVELRYYVGEWLALDGEEDFDYVSVDADEVGIVQFHRREDGLWWVGSVWFDPIPEAVVSFGELRRACCGLIREVDDWVLERFGMPVEEVPGWDAPL